MSQQYTIINWIKLHVSMDPINVLLVKGRQWQVDQAASLRITCSECMHCIINLLLCSCCIGSLLWQHPLLINWTLCVPIQSLFCKWKKCCQYNIEKIMFRVWSYEEPPSLGHRLCRNSLGPTQPLWRFLKQHAEWMSRLFMWRYINYLRKHYKK